jgi:hypothetical protein
MTRRATSDVFLREHFFMDADTYDIETVLTLDGRFMVPNVG